MHVCRYTYCRFPSREDHPRCPVCGYPVDDSHVQDMALARENLPELPVPSLIDMHQIIPNREGALDSQLEMMGALKIERALLQSVPTKVASIMGNRQLLDIGRKHAEKFTVSHFMDPRHPLARKRLRQYRERGVRLIKLLPCLGYRPDDPRWDRFWQTMEGLGLIAMVHTGFITARHKDEERWAGVYLHSKYGRPIFFDILARKFPGIPFILCHMGGAMWVEEAVEMVNQHENVWGDVSGSGAGALRKMIRDGMPVEWSKLFWGNDSAPWAYPYNLRLLLRHLQDGDRMDAAPLLLHDNAERFIGRFLS